MKRTPPSIVLVVALGSAPALAEGPVASKSSRPNVLLLIADDLNTEIGAYGSRIVRTPSLDRLAARGVRFDHAYSQFPVCNPSRTSFLSGRRPETTGVRSNNVSPRERLGRLPFLNEYFRAHGYRALGVGKVAHWGETLAWDAYGPARHGSPKLDPDSDDPHQAWRSAGDEADLPDSKHAQAALRFLREPGGTPFFLAVGFSLPHLPLIVPTQYLQMYPPEGVSVPAVGPTSFPAVAAQGRSGLKKLSDTDARRFRAGYFAAISFLDSRVGLILDELDRQGLWRNTIVVLTSDHGFLLGEHGLWGKHTLFEQAARVPLLVAAPGARDGIATDALVELVDLFPTLAELCGLPLPEGLEGLSLAPLLSNPALPWKSAAFTWDQRGRLAASVRTRQYRYTRWPRGDEELYDHGEDPGEERNLARDPARQAILAEMRRVLAAGWRSAVPTR